MKLRTGQQAPPFIVNDIWDNEVNLYNNKSRKTLVMFFRYAECPLCNLRLSEIQRSVTTFERFNIRMIAVFQSPIESLRKQIASRHAFNFAIVADPDRILYDLYRVKPSWLKTFKFFTYAGISHFLAAWRLHYRPGGVEGKLHQIPADFLIDEHNRLSVVHYGDSVFDHLPLVTIFEKANDVEL